MKILVINGHKYYWYSTGKLNMTLFNEIVNSLSNRHEIITTVVEQDYEPEKEIEKYEWADTIIYQSPVNWFGVPWILKKYFDEVFQKDVFYGSCEKYGACGLFCGKKYMFSLTCNSKECDFKVTEGFYDMRGIDEIFIAQHKLHQFCGMEKLETICAYDVVKNPDVERNINRLNFHLNKNLP